MKDLFGQAIFDYQTNNSPQDLITETSISEPDEMSVAYLFRDFSQMPKIEQIALKHAYGRILDVGCGAGSHSLHLQKKGFEVVSIDISPKAIEACRLRGVRNAIICDVMAMQGRFDTILLMMNGTGICGALERLPGFLTKIKSLLAPGGQVLIDSSDIIYMYDEDDNGQKLLPTNAYYGELTFYVRYKNQDEEPFDWLYTDFQTLYEVATHVGLKCDLLAEGDHFDYLARLY